MKVTVEVDKCVAVRQRAVFTPAFFDQREEDGVVVLQPRPPVQPATALQLQ